MKKILSLSTSKVWWLLTGLGFLIYSNTFQSSFMFDDRFAIVGNQTIHHLFDLHTLWEAFNTRFLVGLSLAFNYALGGENVLGYHLFNISVHILNSFLVYCLVCLTLTAPRMSKRVSSIDPKLLGLLGALIFLTHPIQVSSVSYVWQRSTSMATLFYLATIFFYGRARLRSSSHDYWLSLILAVLGMFTKEIVFTLPFAIALYEFTFLAAPSGEKKNKTFFLLAPFFLTLLIIPLTMTQANARTLELVIHKTKENRFDPNHQDNSIREVLQIVKDAKIDQEPMTPTTLILTRLSVLRTYLSLYFFPVSRSFGAGLSKVASLQDPNGLLSLMTAFSVFLVAILLFRIAPFVAFGIFWFFLTVSVETLVLRGGVVFHRLYLPMLGFSFVIVAAADHFFRNHPRKLIVFLLGLVSLYSLLSYQGNFSWKDEFTMWDRYTHNFPNKPEGFNARGALYKNRGLVDEATRDFNKAIELDPTYAAAYINRAGIYDSRGLAAEAFQDCNMAIQFDPMAAEAYNNRGLIYSNRGYPDLALLDLNKAIDLAPDHADAYSNRSIVFHTKGLLDAAIEDLNKSIALKPDFAEAYNNRGFMYENKGFFDKALADYNKAGELKPTLANVYSNRASVYLKMGSLDLSLAECNKVIAMNPNSARGYVNRAVVYEQKKEHDKSQQDLIKAKSLEAHP